MTFIVTRAVSFLDDLPLAIVTPLSLDYPEPRPLVLFSRSEDDITYIGDGLLANYVTLKFRPEGRKFLYTV